MKGTNVLFLILFIVAGALLYADFPGNCLEFDGVDDFVLGSGIPSSMSEFTLECWVKHNGDVTSNQRYVALKAQTVILRCQNNNSLEFIIKQSDGLLESIIVPQVMPVDSWQHVAASYDGTTLKLYLNGNLIGEGTAPVGGLYSFNGDYEISGYSETMDGFIDEVRLWNDVRTQEEIKANRFQSLTGSESGLLALWNLDETFQLYVYDSAGSCDGDMFGMGEDTRHASTIPATGVLAGTTLDFDGIDDYVVVEQNCGLPIYGNGSQLTISAWVKSPPVYDDRIYSESTTGVNDPLFCFGQGHDGTFRIYIRTATGSVINTAQSAGVVFDDTWHHVCFTDNNGDAHLYIDGTEDPTDFSYTRQAINFDRSTIGGIYRSGLTNNMEGCIDELHIYSRALSTSEIGMEMYGSLQGDEDGLVACWKFNEGSSAELNDIANGNTGFLQNMDDTDWVGSGIPAYEVQGGSIASDTVWSDETIYIAADITVESGATLTIEPGVTVRFLGRYKLDIDGRLLAIGSHQDSIRFTADASTGWGAIRFYNTPTTNDSSKVIHCIIENGKTGGSGLDIQGGGILFYNVDKVLVKDCAFRNNRAPATNGKGGAIYIGHGTPVIENCVFENNYADADGGAVNLYDSDTDFINCIFKNNECQNKGGAVSQSGSTSANWFTNCLFVDNTAREGGALWTLCDVNLLNCTIAGNTAMEHGGGLYYYSVYGYIKNCIIWGNTASDGNQMSFQEYSAINFTYCDIEGGMAGFSYQDQGQVGGSYLHCFDLQPNFRETGDLPWKLGSNSPCINAGDPNTSMSGVALEGLDGFGRFMDSEVAVGSLDDALDRIDIGAYEVFGYNNIPDGTVIEEDQTLQGRFYIYPGFTVTIDPGVTIDMSINSEFIVYGNLIADGTANEPITFTRTSEYETWCGLIFRDVMDDIPSSSHFEYCTIEYSRQQSYISYPDFLTGNYVSHNDGGIIHAEDYEDLTFVNCKLLYGSSYDDGGAIYLDNTNLHMTGCLIAENYCPDDGGAICSNESEVSLINCTIAGNSNLGSGALNFSTHNPQPVITNCVVWGNGNDPVYPVNGTLTEITWSDIEGGYAGDGNIDVDPDFKESGDDPYDLEAWSFCINVATEDTTGLALPANDILGNPRIYAHDESSFDRVDMGAYEHQGYLAPGHLAASDGANEYPGYVQLLWDFNPDYDMVPTGFRVFRNDISIVTLEGQTHAYSDYTAVPGQVYNYYVQSYYGNEEGDSNCDSGYLKPNGVITGTITTSNNNPVAGVKVSINPSNGFCLELDENSSFEIEDPLCDNAYDCTFELWLRTPLANTPVISQGNHGFSIGGGALSYTDGVHTITEVVDSVDVSDNGWHHIAMVSDYANTSTYLYIDGIEVASNSTFLMNAPLSGNIVSGAGYAGYIDDIRVWSTARTQDDIMTAMNIVVAWDSQGLEGYWPLNEGTGSVAYDGTSNAHNGAIANPDWSLADPDIQLGAISDEWGEYEINQIPYGAVTTFAVTPSKTGHLFQPESRNVTLSESNIAQNGIDFTDNSLIPITGRAIFMGTNCAVDGATILLNGETTIPVVTTDEDGYYTMEVEHGQNTQLSVSYNEHPMNRTWDLGVVTYPRTNINFEDILRTQFRCEVVGGSDRWPLGEFDIYLNSVCGCYRDTITTGSWLDGTHLVTNVPPLSYNVTVEPRGSDPFGLVIDNQFQNMKTAALDLLNPDEVTDTLTYVWRAPMEISVTWPDTLSAHTFAEYPEYPFYVLQQNIWYEIEIGAFEDYNFGSFTDHVTWLTDCELTVQDDIGTQGETVHDFAGETSVIYRFAPHLPNTLSGFNRQYQNSIEFRVDDPNLDNAVIQTDWALTEGVKPLESTYASTSPDIPFLVLHDPPGDASQGVFSQSSSHSISFEAAVCTSQEHNAYMNIHLGPDFTWETGCAVMSVEHEVDIVADIGMGITVGTEQTESMEQTLTFTTSTEYATSEEDQVIGDGSDLFVGGALNLIWGVTNEISYNDTTQSVDVETSVMVSPNGFATVYVYTDNQIRNTVIPNLITIGDAESADLWQSFLDMNETNKANALPNPNHPENLSFNAGAGYTYEEECESTEGATIEFTSTVSGEFGLEIGGTVDGIGGEVGYQFSTAVTIGKSSSSETTTTTTTSFTLADDDETSDLNELADYFTVDVLVDPVYGTPVFELVSGASSCPWEPNTQPREGVTMSANRYTETGLLEGEEAAFVLTLGNTSQTGEDRRYYLSVMNETNPHGAEIRINGVPVEDAMAFDVLGNSAVQAVMTVGQGPTEYVYNDLTLLFYSEGDRGNDGPDDHFFEFERSFDVSWEAPYSRVAIESPHENWIINQAAGDSLFVLLSEYDTDKPSFYSLKLQYKRLEETIWNPGFEILREELESAPHYIRYPWYVDQLSDDAYEIRAAAVDSLLGVYYTAPVPGVIDQHSPEVLGLPEPADGILQRGDEISIFFDELIDPLSVTIENVSVDIIGGIGDVVYGVGCFENKIVVTILSANHFIENQTLEVTVSNVNDLYGNALEAPVEWEFFVNANPVYWETTKMEIIKPLGEEMLLTNQLINSGGQLSSFAIESIPVWLTVNPMSGSLLPLDSEVLTFTISEQLGFGTYRDTIYANIPGLGSEPLVIEIGVLADPPAWSMQMIGGYDYSMSITGQMSIEGVVSNDLNDVIGAFIEDAQGNLVCHGYAQTELVPYLENTYAFFLTVQSDIEYGEEIIFRVWDASECKEHYGIAESFVFLEGAVYGTPVAPTVVHAEPDLVRSISCNQGWTWLSTNLDNQTSMSVDSLLASLNPVAGDLIKNQTEYAQYVDGVGWVGSLAEISTTEMVKIKLTTDDELLLTGLLEDPYTASITYGSGWNWIGFIPHVSVSVTEALDDIDNPVTGDLIKSQKGFAQFIEGYGWVGSLLFMNPGEGYMLNTQNSGSFHYPDYNLTRGLTSQATSQRAIAAIPDIPGWELDPLDYEYSANITGNLWLDEVLLNDPDIVIGAFVGEECRGIASPIQVQGNYLYFLTVYSNQYFDTVTFKAWNEQTGEFCDLDDTLSIVSNQIIGDPVNPHEFQLPTGILSAPKNLRISIQSGNVSLSWDSVAGATSYKVYSISNPTAQGDQWTLEAITAATSWDCLLPSGNRYYRVTASTEAVRSLRKSTQ